MLQLELLKYDASITQAFVIRPQLLVRAIGQARRDRSYVRCSALLLDRVKGLSQVASPLLFQSKEGLMKSCG